MDDDDGDDKGAPPSPDHHFIGGLGPETDDDETLIWSTTTTRAPRRRLTARTRRPRRRRRRICRRGCWRGRSAGRAASRSEEDIHAFYAKHNPEKVKEAPALIDKYKAKGVHEPELLEAIVRKYRATSTKITNSTAATSCEGPRGERARPQVESPPVTPERACSPLPGGRARRHRGGETAEGPASSCTRTTRTRSRARSRGGARVGAPRRDDAKDRRFASRTPITRSATTHHDLEHQASHLGHVGHGFRGLSHMAHGLEHQASRLGEDWNTRPRRWAGDWCTPSRPIID